MEYWNTGILESWNGLINRSKRWLAESMGHGAKSKKPVNSQPAKTGNTFKSLKTLKSFKSFKALDWLYWAEIPSRHK
jgi:hypothetical protein